MFVAEVDWQLDLKGFLVRETMKDTFEKGKPFERAGRKVTDLSPTRLSDRVAALPSGCSTPNGLLPARDPRLEVHLCGGASH